MTTHLSRDPANGHWLLVRDGDGDDVAKSADVEELLEDVAVIKSVAEQRYLLGVAWEPGKNDRITKGKDGERDFMTTEEVEKAAWELLAGGGEIGFFHQPGTTGHVELVESYVYRGPDWPMRDAAGHDVVIKAGTWLVGGICDDAAWDIWKAGLVGGMSPQGKATRRRFIPRSTP